MNFTKKLSSPELFKWTPKTCGDIEGKNSFMKFELNPIIIEGPKLGLKVFRTGNPKFAFWTLGKKFTK